MAVLLILHRC